MGTPLGVAAEAPDANIIGKVNGVSYTVAKGGIVKADGTLVNSLGDSEIGYNYLIKNDGSDANNSLYAEVKLNDVSTFADLKQAMSNVPAEVEGITAGSAIIDVPVHLNVTLNDDITVTEELTCKANCAISGPNRTISRGASYKGCLFFVENGTSLGLMGDGTGELIIDGGNVADCNSLILVDTDATCKIAYADLKDNKAVYGGAIYNKGTVTISKSEMNSCSAEQGGAILNKGVLNSADGSVTITGCHAAIGGAVANLGEAANFNTNGFKFEASNYATDKGNQVYTSGTMNAITGLVLNKSAAEGVDIFIENKPIVLNSNVAYPQFVSAPVVFLITYDQVGDGPKLWRGAKAGESVFVNSIGNSYTVAGLKYAGVETLGINGKLNSITGNLLSTPPCSGYVGTQVNGNTIITEYLPVYFTNTNGYSAANSYIINSLTGKEVLSGSAIAVEDSQNADFEAIKPKSAADTEDETDIDVLAALRVAKPTGAETKYFNITWGKTAAGFYTLVLRNSGNSIVGIAPFYYDAVEPEFDNITYKVGTAAAVEVPSSSSSVSVAGNVSGGVTLAFDFNDAGVAAVKTIALTHPAGSEGLDATKDLSRNPTDAPYVNHCKYKTEVPGTYTFKLTDFSGRTNSLTFNVGISSDVTPTTTTTSFSSSSSSSSSSGSSSGSSSSGSSGSSGSSSSSSSSGSSTTATTPTDTTTVTVNGETIKSTSGNFSLTGSSGIFKSAESLRKAFNSLRSLRRAISSNVVDEVEIISGEKIPMDEVAWATTTAATTTATSKTTDSESLFTTSSKSEGESGESGVRVNGESVRKAAGSTETGEMSNAEAKKVYAYMQNWEKKNGKINLDTDMAEKSALLTKAIKKNEKLFGNGEDIQIITFGKVQKKLPFEVDVYGAADLISKKLKIDLLCSVYKINRSTGKLVKKMGVYTMRAGVVTFSADDTKYAYVIEESPLVVEKTKGKYEILSDGGFEMTLAELKAKTKDTIRLVVNDEDSTLIINSADIQASTATSKDKLLLQIEKQDATKYKKDAKTNIVLDTGDLGTLGCTTTIYLETDMKKKSITVWGLDSKGAVVKLGKAKTDANGILKITAKAATLKKMGKSKVAK